MTTIWLIGAGNMGSAMLRGWLANGIAPGAVTVVDPFAKALPEGVTLLPVLPANSAPDLLVLAIKPQQLAAFADAYAAAAALPPRLLLSVLAGVETASLKKTFGARHVVRAMPNLPAAIGQGVTVLFGDMIDAPSASEVVRLVEPLGSVEWISDERLFDAITALSGSGPGYVFRFIEALAEAGAALGLAPALAERLAVATVRGSALLAEQSAAAPAALADQVASPGGTTREGLNVLDDGAALKSLLSRALAAAAQRSEELSAITRG